MFVLLCMLDAEPVQQRKTLVVVSSWFSMQFARECSFRSSLLTLHLRYEFEISLDFSI